MKASWFLLLAAAAAVRASAAPQAAVLFARGAWAALDRGTVCEAVSRSVRTAPRGQPQAIAGFSFSPDRRRWGEFHARLSHVPRAGASILLTVGDQPFLLVARGDWAWSRSPLQDQAIITAVRTGVGMKLESRDSAGRRFADPYALSGAPTAIDAAAARCAGKSR